MDAAAAEKKVPVQVKLSPKVARYLRIKSTDERRDISAIVEDLLIERFGGESIAAAMPLSNAS